MNPEGVEALGVEELDPDAQSLKVLVIDDEAVIREGCVEILATEGYSVAVASGGAEGLDLARSLEPDVVVVDLRMPGVGGMEVIRVLAEERPTAVVVVITGYATIDHAVESIKCGAFDFLPKPFTPGDLRRAVKKGLERKKVLVELSALRAERRRLTEYYTSIVSHQLRTPIAAVRQYFEVILGGYAGEVPAETLRIITRASVRLTELTELIEDWLSLARLDEEALRARFVEVDLAALARRVLAELEPELAERRMTAEVRIEGPLPTLRGHPGSLEQVLDNLVGNAIKYGREGGRVAVGLAPEGDGVRVEVEDDGIGVAAEHVPFLFNEFYRAKTDETRDIPGTGLGLAIVRKFVAAHDGTVEVRSQLGSGSCFTVRLPAGGSSAAGDGDGSKAPAVRTQDTTGGTT